ncbi:pyridine nucleotide-disulfide oxidoreductase [candidate division KSB1 bacterium]|nr:MAG: pyridine nucleotide-disulfide oxidoreductase [candidate division KSB1 bacterium]
MKTDVLIIGGGPGGVITAVIGRAMYPDKNFTLVRQEPKAVVPCGIPYVFNRLQSVEENIMGDAPLEANHVSLVIGTVSKIDRSNKRALLEDGEEIVYDKVVLATGSIATAPAALKAPGMSGIFVVKKDLEYIRQMREKIHAAKNVVIIGGGFIGVEIADEIKHLPEKTVSIVEMANHLMEQSFDEEFAIKAEDFLRQENVNIFTQRQVVGYEGDGAVRAVILDDGTKIDADAVILSIGSKPNTVLAEEMGLDVSPLGGIKVDEFMRTSDTDVFAVGDCAEKRCFFCRKHINIMLASTATAEARSAGANLYHIKMIEMNKGTIGIYSTKVGDLVLATAGHTEANSIVEGYEVVTGVSKGIDRHPGTIPGKHALYVKMIFSRYSGILMGAQVCGGDSAGELINTIGLAIQSQLTMTDIATIQYGTHPLLTAAPTTYPLIACAQDAFHKLHSGK